MSETKTDRIIEMDWKKLLLKRNTDIIVLNAHDKE